jgi:hypothetical protein
VQVLLAYMMVDGKLPTQAKFKNGVFVGELSRVSDHPPRPLSRWVRKIGIEQQGTRCGVAVRMATVIWQASKAQHSFSASEGCCASPV